MSRTIPTSSHNLFDCSIRLVSSPDIRVQLKAAEALAAELKAELAKRTSPDPMGQWGFYDHNLNDYRVFDDWSACAAAGLAAFGKNFESSQIVAVYS